MDKNETCRLIDAAGGDKPFAERLGLTDRRGYQQRVNNWRRRGMPASVVLDHLDVIREIQRQSRVDKVS
jgi:hypothetical protein